MPQHPLSVQFGLRIRELREALGMSQEAFALHAGIARSYMSRIERGHAEPRFEALSKLATAFSVTPSALFEPPITSTPKKRVKSVLVPFAADGTCFNPTLRQPKTGEFAVGSKSERKKFPDFHDALTYLKTMEKAAWLRPSKTGGNDGVVVANGPWKPLPAEYMRKLK
jgi:transcriptional regulator with XRE-family HTH domain